MQRYDGDIPEAPDRYTLSAAPFWASITAAALVTAAVAAVTAHSLVGPPGSHGGWGDGRTTAYAIGAASVTALAGALMHLLTLKVADPRRHFVWLMAVATSTAMIIPVALDDRLGAGIATALVILAIGTVATGTVHSIALATCRPWTPAREHSAVAAVRQWTVPRAYYPAPRPLR